MHFYTLIQMKTAITYTNSKEVVLSAWEVMVWIRSN